MEEYTERLENLLKKENLEVSYVPNKNPGITDSKYSGNFEFKNAREIGLLGYGIYLREFKEGDNFYVHDFLCTYLYWKL